MKPLDDYHAFLRAKQTDIAPAGFDVPRAALGDHLFPFQKDIVQWAVRTGRAAVFADTGLGKTRMLLTWAHAVVERHPLERVLVLAPLAVSAQTVREGERIGLHVRAVRSQDDVGSGISITNYEMLEHFDQSAFAGVVLDESSILKSFMGATKRRLIDAFRATPYRLACTATPAPNDHLELGNHAEFLGVLTSHEMLARWFLPDAQAGTYRLKGHAVRPFWDWVTSWAMCVGKPSDLGYSDDGYVLPKLDVRLHDVDVDITQDRGDALFRVPEVSATSLHKEKRRTTGERARCIADLVAAEPHEAWCVWCDTDYEADALAKVIPGAVDVRGSMSREAKEAALVAFAEGHPEARVLVSKPRLAGFGLNFQHCARVAFIGASFSYEAFYQTVRRCWRFGQRREVVVHVAMTAAERQIWDVVLRKTDDHEAMKAEMFAAARRAAAAESKTVGYAPARAGHLPSWLKSEVA